MGLTLVDGEILRGLSEDTAEGQFDYVDGSGQYNRVVVVGATDASDADTDRVGLLRGSKVHFRTDSIDANYIPVINVRASEAILLSPKVIDESGNTFYHTCDFHLATDNKSTTSRDFGAGWVKA